MWGLNTYSNPTDIIDANANNSDQIQLSSEIALKVYELDTWALFLVILQYLDCLNICLEAKEDWVGFYDTLPRSAHPATWFEEQYGLYLTSKKSLKVIMPASFSSFDLEDISLYTENV